MKKDAADLYALALVHDAIKGQSSFSIASNNSVLTAENIVTFVTALSNNLQAAVDDNVAMADVMKLVTGPFQPSR